VKLSDCFFAVGVGKDDTVRRETVDVRREVLQVVAVGGEMRAEARTVIIGEKENHVGRGASPTGRTEGHGTDEGRTVHGLGGAGSDEIRTR
jgi:hypothetical protein